jgi:hypothetical protein
MYSRFLRLTNCHIDHSLLHLLSLLLHGMENSYTRAFQIQTNRIRATLFRAFDSQRCVSRQRLLILRRRFGEASADPGCTDSHRMEVEWDAGLQASSRCVG